MTDRPEESDPEGLPLEEPRDETAAAPVVSPSLGLWEPIKRHKIVQWTVAYLALAYTLLHGAEMLGNSFGWSHGLLRSFTVLLILGIPIVMTLAWYHGARGLQRASGTEVMIIAILLAVGGAFLWRDSEREDIADQTATGSSDQAVRTPEVPIISERTVAVLPFVNMSSDKEQEYFSDGLSEELLNLLSKVPDLRVAARTSSFYFKGKEAKLPDIARELQVAHLLEGSVRKSGNRIRITAQLIRASDGYHRWSETYDRSLDDIFAVQEEIAAAVVSELKATLLGAPPKLHKTTPEAYALYLQAKQLDRLWSGRIEESIALYQQALAIDPGYAPAWLWLSEKFGCTGMPGSGPAEQSPKLGREAVGKALAIDPDYAAAHAALGWVALHCDQDLAASARHLEHALALDPVDPVALSIGLQLNEALGRQDKSVELMEYLVSRDPMEPYNHDTLGGAYLDAGRLDDALGSYRALSKLTPDALGLHASIADVLLLKGQYEAALAEYRNEPSEPDRLAGLACAHYALGQEHASDAALDELIEKHADDPGLIATVFAYRREIGRAFEWLNRAAASGSSLSSAPVNLWLKNLHDDPRWLPFLRSIGKAPEQLAAIKFELNVPKH